MDIAVVTGASSGLGLAISRRLLDLGFRVYGLGGNYSESTVPNVDFRPTPCDLADPGHVEARIKEILEKEGAITVLVNNAKYYPPDDFAQGAPAEFSRSLNINLLCPLILVRWCLEGLRRTRGTVVNISSATPETSRGGPIGACAAGGLRWMQESLFQQLREDGVAVSTIYPEPNRWRPEDAPPPNGERPQSAIDPQAVAEALMSILHHGRSNVITEVVIRPERLVERTIPPVRELPYPKPKPIPYTVPREQIEAEERAEREEEEREMSLGEKPEQTGAPKKRRRRGRGRGRDRERGDDSARPEGAPEDSAEAGESEASDEPTARQDDRGPRRDERPEAPNGNDSQQDRGPRRDERGPRRDDRGPRREDRQPRRDDRGPRRDERSEPAADREAQPERREEDRRRPRRDEREETRSPAPADRQGRPERADSRRERPERGDQPREDRRRDERSERQASPAEPRPAQDQGQSEESEERRSRSRRRRGRKPRPASIAGDLPARVEPRPGPIAVVPDTLPPVPAARVTPAPAPKPVVVDTRRAAQHDRPAWAATVMPRPAKETAPPKEPAPASKRPDTKPAESAPAAKTARKAAKKAATKNSAVKKTATKKAAVKKTAAKKVARKRVTKKATGNAAGES